MIDTDKDTFLADGGEITEETRIQSGNLHRQNKCQ